MIYPCKGRVWFYIGSILALACFATFLWFILHTPYSSIGNVYTVFLPCFLAACMLRIYAVTPLMNPKLGVLIVIALFLASQVFTVFFWFGHFLLGYVVGHFAELGTFAWAYNKSRRLYEQQPL